MCLLFRNRQRPGNWVAWATVLRCPWASTASETRASEYTCPCHPILILVVLLFAAGQVCAQLCCGADDASGPPGPGVLRVCADPNNLPFSNARGEGFENKLAELIARDLNEKVTYTWTNEHEHFVRKTLNTGKCDVLMGVPAGFGDVETTAPYYT